MPDKDIPETNEPKPVLKKPTFSKPQLILFAAAFALIGGYTLFRTFAAESVIASLEAEQMVLPAKAQVITDSSASAGKAIKLTSSATATASVNLPANTTSLTLSAKAKPCKLSSITVKLYVDDTLVMSRKVNSSNWTKFSVTKKLPKGVHKLSIKGSGINSYPNICNSELSLDVVNFTGNSTPPTPAPTISFSASPTSVTAGGAATLTWNSTNATSCSASGAWSGAKPTSGSASTGALNATAIYNLTCQGASGTASASSTVSVNAATPAEPSPAPPGATVLPTSFKGRYSAKTGETITASGQLSQVTIRVSVANVTIKNLKIQGAETGVSRPAVIDASGSTKLLIEDVEIIGDGKQEQGLYAAGGSDMTIRRSVFGPVGVDRYFDHCFYLNGHKNFLVENVTCTAPAGAGIHLYSGGATGTVRNCVLKGSRWGVVAWGSGNRVLVENCWIYGHRKIEGGRGYAIEAASSGIVDYRNNYIWDNEAAGNVSGHPGINQNGGTTNDLGGNIFAAPPAGTPSPAGN